MIILLQKKHGLDYCNFFPSAIRFNVNWDSLIITLFDAQPGGEILAVLKSTVSTKPFLRKTCSRIKDCEQRGSLRERNFSAKIKSPFLTYQEPAKFDAPQYLSAPKQ